MASVSEQVPSTIEISRRIPGYSIETELGRGSTGVVYLAQELALGRKVALKVLAPSLAHEDRFRRRFTRESQAAANLEHPNVIPIYAAGESNGLLYIAMRCVDGPDLRTLLEREGTLSLDRTAEILGQVAAALDAAHDEGLVHRDIKPANILIDRRRGASDRGEHVYLCDFGITKHTSSGDGLTATGQFVGTIDYVAPEQIQGKPVDGRADLYALGCVAYQCLTGKAPFRRDEESGVLWAHMNTTPPEVTTVRPDLQPAVDRVIGKAMAKEPVDRYSTCAEFTHTLRALSSAPARQQKSVETTIRAGSGPPPITGPGRAPAGRVPPGQALPGGASPGGVPVGQAPLRRRRGALIGVGVVVALILLGAGAFFFLQRRFPTGAEAALLGRVPDELASTCTRNTSDAPGDAPGATASLRCRPAMGAEEMLLTSFGSPDALQAAYDQLVSGAEVRLGTGECASGPAENAYANGAQATGRVLCWSAGGAASIGWTDTATNALATATRPDGKVGDLYTWWVGLVERPEPFPTADEQRLSQQLIETGCTRADPEALADFPGAIAGVACPPLNTGAASVHYFQFRDRQSMHRVYDGDVQASRPPADVSCFDSPPGFLGESFYYVGSDTGDPDGRLYCFTRSDGKVVVEWTHEPTNILARAVGDGDGPALITWWRNSSGPRTASDEAPASLTVEDQALLGVIPLDSRVGCTSARADMAAIAGVTAAVRCGPVGGAQTVLYLQFADQAAMQAVYDQEVLAAGVTPSGPDGPFCENLPPNFLAEHGYSIGGNPAGRLLCYTDADGVPLIVATHDDLNLLMVAFARDNDANALIVWWYGTPSLG